VRVSREERGLEPLAKAGGSFLLQVCKTEQPARLRERKVTNQGDEQKAPSDVRKGYGPFPHAPRDPSLVTPA